MSDLGETKRRMEQALKAHFSRLPVPGEVTKKVVKMRLEARLTSGADLSIGCAEVKSGRPPGSFGLYWIFAITGGRIYDIMEACGLSVHPSMTTPLIFSCTSHNLPVTTHAEVSPRADFDAVAASICDAVREHAFPTIEGFNSKPEYALDYILTRRPGIVRNPFTTCVILIHLANRLDRLDELIRVASTAQGFYDFKGADDARARIVEPVSRWFAAHA